MIIEIFPDRAGGCRYRIKGNNGEKMVSSQHYRDQTDAWRGVHDLLASFAASREVTVLDETPDDE